MEVIGPDEIRKINPWLATSGVLAGAYTTDDGHVDPSSACNAMAIAARNLGATISRRNRVLDINLLPGGEFEVVTEQGSIVAEHVVNAGGCYAREVGQMVGVQTPITNMEHQYLVTEALQEFEDSDSELPVMRDPYTAGYYRQEQKSGLIGIYEQVNSHEAWGASGGSPEWAAENELFGEDIERISPWLEKALQRMPIFANAGIKRVINGAIPHSPDGNPLLGPAHGIRNFWQCCGSSIGIAQGAGCGKYLAQWMVHGQAEINMREFDPRRFGPYADNEYTRAKSFDDYENMFATPLPGEERDAGRPNRTTPLYETLKTQGAVYTEVFGWERPKWFSPDGRQENPGFRRNNVFEIVAGECRAVRERVGVMDLSSFAKYDVSGPDAPALLDRITANRMPRSPGGLVLTHILSADGMIEGEVTITHMADDSFFVLSGVATELEVHDKLLQSVGEGEDVTIDNITDDYGMLVVAGPRSRELLARLTDADLANDSFPWLTGQQIDIAGVPCRALRVNYVGELGWELHAPMAQLAELYDAIWNAGGDFEIANFGAYAVNSLRMEKAYRGLGSELTNEITLIEADMARFVALDKGGFVGKDATQARQNSQISTRLVYAEVDADDSDILGGEPVFHGSEVVGVCTSGGFGHAVQKSLAFAYVDPQVSDPGTVLEVQILGERYPLRTLGDPAHDPENARMRT